MLLRVIIAVTDVIILLNDRRNVTIANDKINMVKTNCWCQSVTEPKLTPTLKWENTESTFNVDCYKIREILNEGGIK